LWAAPKNHAFHDHTLHHRQPRSAAAVPAAPGRHLPDPRPARHAPVLEEDIALTNLSLDLIGQSRALYSHAATVEQRLTGVARDEDAYAFLREERDYRNPTLVELPLRRGISGPAEDFAGTVLRNLLVATLLKQVWEALSAPGGTATPSWPPSPPRR
jgi:hypothetical protein